MPFIDEKPRPQDLANIAPPDMPDDIDPTMAQTFARGDFWDRGRRLLWRDDCRHTEKSGPFRVFYRVGWPLQSGLLRLAALRAGVHHAYHARCIGMSSWLPHDERKSAIVRDCVDTIIVAVDALVPHVERVGDLIGAHSNPAFRLAVPDDHLADCHPDERFHRGIIAAA